MEWEERRRGGGGYLVHACAIKVMISACGCARPWIHLIRYGIIFRKVASNVVLLVGVNIAGVLYYYLAELAQRKTFSETRSYISSLVNIDEQRRKQVRPSLWLVCDPPCGFPSPLPPLFFLHMFACPHLDHAPSSSPHLFGPRPLFLLPPIWTTPPLPPHLFGPRPLSLSPPPPPPTCLL